MTAPLLALWAALAVAAPPVGLRPVPMPTDAAAQYEQWRVAARAPSSALPCEPGWGERVLVCFRVWEGGERRWVVSTDLERWRVTGPELLAATAARAPEALARLEERPIVDMGATWWVLSDGDGGAAAALLAPEALAAKVGLPLRAAIPRQGVLVAWRVVDADVDRVMAIGVHELWADQADAVSPDIFTWDGELWLPWGHAEPAKP